MKINKTISGGFDGVTLALSLIAGPLIYIVAIVLIAGHNARFGLIGAALICLRIVQRADRLVAENKRGTGPTQEGKS